MNKELINKIRLDAGIARLNDSYDYAVVSLNREGKVIDPLEGLEIFAELIVKECVNTIKSNWDNIDESIDLYKVLTQDIYIAAVRDECCAEIKKHFGVEEE